MRNVALSLSAAAALVTAASSRVAYAGEKGTEVKAGEVDASERAGTALYFALEIRREGRLIAAPKLLGDANKLLKVERRPPDAALPDYQLQLTPVPQGKNRFSFHLELAVPGLSGASDVAIDHAQELKLELGPKPGALEVKLLVMLVDSPEFRALMKYSPRNSAGQLI